MTTLPLSRLVPGITPDPDETLVFWVESDSDPWAAPYRVDLTCYSGNGKCDCVDFATRRNGDLVRGECPCLRLECKHIRRARRYLSFQIINRIIEQKTEEGNANKQKAKASQLANRVSRAAEADEQVAAW